MDDKNQEEKQITPILPDPLQLRVMRFEMPRQTLEEAQKQAELLRSNPKPSELSRKPAALSLAPFI